MNDALSPEELLRLVEVNQQCPVLTGLMVAIAKVAGPADLHRLQDWYVPWLPGSLASTAVTRARLCWAVNVSLLGSTPLTLWRVGLRAESDAVARLGDVIDAPQHEIAVRLVSSLPCSLPEAPPEPRYDALLTLLGQVPSPFPPSPQPEPLREPLLTALQSLVDIQAFPCAYRLPPVPRPATKKALLKVLFDSLDLCFSFVEPA